MQGRPVVPQQVFRDVHRPDLAVGHVQHLLVLLTLPLKARVVHFSSLKGRVVHFSCVGCVGGVVQVDEGDRGGGWVGR